MKNAWINFDTLRIKYYYTFHYESFRLKMELEMHRMTKRNKRLKKRHALFKLAMLIIGISAFLPSNLLESNLQLYEDHTSRALANHALKMTTDTFHNSLDQVLIVSYSIESMEEKDGELISSVVIAYTVFGIPYAEVIATNDGAYVNKKFLFNN